MPSIPELRTVLARKGFTDVTVKPSNSPGIAFTITAPFFVDNDITNITIDDSNNITIRREEYANFITINPKTLQLLALLRHTINRKDDQNDY